MTGRVVLAALVLLGGTALADTVVLKNGRRIEGRIVEDTEREVTIDRGGVLMRFDRKQVASVEKDEQPGVAPPRPSVPDDLGVPDGATDDEIQRLQQLVPQLRDTSRRYLDARKQREEAEKKSDASLSYCKDREAEFRKQLDGLVRSREAIDKSAAERFAKTKRQAEAEAATLRADSDKLKEALDAPGLAERAEKLKARVPESPREPRHATLLAEVLYAMERSGDVDERLAKGAKTPESRVAGLVRAGEHFGWCIEADESASEHYLERAIEAYSAAHRAAGIDTGAIELALMNLLAYRTCANLVEERLGERRWGPELAESEAGQFKLELKERAVYGNEAPAARDARSAWERRDRTENRPKDGGGTVLVKVTRWYQLVYDASKKRWARDSAVTELESAKLVPLLRETQDKVDLLAKAKADLRAAQQATRERKDALAQVRRKLDQAETTDAELEDASKKAADQAKVVAVAQDGVAQAQAALGVKQRQIVELQKEIERARKGE
jgi:hypothetical protein